jgi:hypothetical protein
MISIAYRRKPPKKNLKGPLDAFGENIKTHIVFKASASQ